MYSVCYNEFFDILTHNIDEVFDFSGLVLAVSCLFPVYFWLETAKYILLHLKSQMEALKYIHSVWGKNL